MGFSSEIIRAVWSKGIVVAGYDYRFWRKDKYGAWIGWEYYGNRNSEFGWEIDHIKPVSLGGSDIIFNLQPLHWQNNSSKQDKLI